MVKKTKTKQNKKTNTMLHENADENDSRESPQ